MLNYGHTAHGKQAQSPNDATYRGPINSPTKLISGYSSWGIMTLSLTLVAGGLGTENTTV